MNNKKYKELVQATSKKVKTIDKMLAVSRKHTNEFVEINLESKEDSGWFGRDILIHVKEEWYNPITTYCSTTNSNTIRPSYTWELSERFWENSKPWTLDFYKTDLKDGNHRPLVIHYIVGETQGHYAFIYTKRELDRAFNSRRLFPIALKQFELKNKWTDTSRILGNEIEEMKDDDVMVITARGFDQSDEFIIENFKTYSMDQGIGYEPGDIAEQIVGLLVDLSPTSSLVTDY